MSGEQRDGKELRLIEMAKEEQKFRNTKEQNISQLIRRFQFVAVPPSIRATSLNVF